MKTEGNRKMIICSIALGVWTVIVSVGMIAGQITGQMALDASKYIFGIVVIPFMAGNGIEWIGKGIAGKKEGNV